MVIGICIIAGAREERDMHVCFQKSGYGWTHSFVTDCIIAQEHWSLVLCCLVLLLLLLLLLQQQHGVDMEHDVMCISALQELGKEEACALG